MPSRTPSATEVLQGALMMMLLAISALSGHAHSPSDVAAYRELIDQYRAGSPAADVDLASRIHDPSIIERLAESASGWTAVDLSAGAMLHTDAWLRLLKGGRRSDAVVHLDAATTLLRAVVDRKAEWADFARRWRVTVAALIHGELPDIASSLCT